MVPQRDSCILLPQLIYSLPKFLSIGRGKMGWGKQRERGEVPVPSSLTRLVLCLPFSLAILFHQPTLLFLLIHIHWLDLAALSDISLTVFLKFCPCPPSSLSSDTADLATIPRHPNSTGWTLVFYLLCSDSVFKSAYLVLSKAASTKSFLSDHKTMSGLRFEQTFLPSPPAFPNR